MISQSQIEPTPDERLVELATRLTELSADALSLAANLKSGAGQGAPARWLTTAEAMADLGISKPTILRYKKEGLLHPVKMGRGDRYSSKELDALYEKIGQGDQGK